VKSAHDMAAPPVGLGSGEYELNLYPLSEILVNKNVRNLGPVVPALQVPVVVTATVSAASPNAAAAEALIAFLRGPAIEPPLKANGFER
jgi:ABC-type molybdate transport system substrate-binding protein